MRLIAEFALLVFVLGFSVTGACWWIWATYRMLVSAWLNGSPNDHEHRKRQGARALEDYGIGLHHDFSIPPDVDAVFRDKPD